MVCRTTALAAELNTLINRVLLNFAVRVSNDDLSRIIIPDARALYFHVEKKGFEPSALCLQNTCAAVAPHPHWTPGDGFNARRRVVE